MDSPKSPEIDHDAPSPLLLKLYFKNGAFHRPDEFAYPRHLRHIPIYTHPTCTLTELTHHLAATPLSPLPSPAIGTRIAYRLIYPDARASGPSGPPRFAVKELGSVVIGSEGSGTDDGFGDADADEDAATLAAAGSRRDANRTLEAARFVTGDVVSAAILPPLENGGVAPLPEIKGPPSGGVGRFGMRGGARGGMRGGGIGSGFDRGPPVPPAEWRRGERLPDQEQRRGGRRDRW